MDTEVKAAPPDVENVLRRRDGGPGAQWGRAVWLALAIASGLATAWYVRDRAPAARYVTAEVTTGALTVNVSATGNLKPRNLVQIGSEVSGTVESVYVDVNDVVHTGQMLARLDTARLKAQLSQVDGALAVAEAHVIQSEASLNEAATYHARLLKVRELSGRKLPSQQDIDLAEASLGRARGEAAAASAAVAHAQATREMIRTDLSKTEIRSPIDGVVLVRSIEPGQTVAASLQAPVLFTLAEDLRQMELDVALDEADVGSVREGQAATFAVDAFPDRLFHARIARIHLASNRTRSKAADELAQSTLSSAGSSSGVVTYQTVLEVENPDLLLRPGMTATAEIVTSLIPAATLVPNAALRFTPQHAHFPGMNDESDRGTGMMALMPYLAERWKCPRENDQALGCVWLLEKREPVLAIFKPGATDRSQTQVLDLDQLPNWSTLSRLRNDPILTTAVAREITPGMRVIVDSLESPQ